MKERWAVIAALRLTDQALKVLVCLKGGYASSLNAAPSDKPGMGAVLNLMSTWRLAIPALHCYGSQNKNACFV